MVKIYNPASLQEDLERTYEYHIHNRTGSLLHALKLHFLKKFDCSSVNDCSSAAVAKITESASS